MSNSGVQLAVVRYVPDPIRDEPRNVGVIAWRRGEVAARFVGEDAAGDMDRRHISRRIVPDAQTYVEWVGYWRTHLANGLVENPTRKARVSVKNPKFLESLANVTRGGFQIRQHGHVVGSEEHSLHHVVSDAFERLVRFEELEHEDDAEALLGKAHHRQLAWNACRALMRNRFQEKRDFIRDYPITGKTGKGNEVPAIFDIAIPAPKDDLLTHGEVLLVDAVSMAAAPEKLNDVVDRARVVATKAQETRKQGKGVFLRALVSNGSSAESNAGRYATRILEDEGELELVTVEQLVTMVPRIRQGQGL